MDENVRYQRGKAMRTRVLGKTHVTKALQATDDFGAIFQQMATEVAWGDVWSRPGLDLKARSLCTIAMLAAAGQLSELKIHTKGALNVGATKDEIGEVLLHVAVFAGLPVATEALRAVREAIAEYAP